MLFIKLKLVLHDLIFFDKSHLSKLMFFGRVYIIGDFWQNHFDKYIEQMHLTYKICQGKFDRVKGALLHGIKERKYGSNLAAKSPFTASFGGILD